jgi:hypothetical protein
MLVFQGKGVADGLLVESSLLLNDKFDLAFS